MIAHPHAHALPLALALLGAALFSVGFFSVRESVETVASDNDLFHHSDLSLALAQSLSLSRPSPPAFKRVLLFIVDALRIDFLASPVNFPYVHSLLKQQQQNRNQNHSSLLLTFRADPPTVTSQRLKALTTGTLPTFIDFRANFHGQQVREDSWLRQLAQKSSSSSIFMGDDTWMSLFPDHFSTALPFDSFNTRDLHTVDDGIERNLFNSSSDTDTHTQGWSLLVAHFLGVDHIGHTHSASHPFMAERLQRMDRLIQRVIEEEDVLPDDALLLVFGDHGMTNEGNHGGATPLETDAGLFAYSRRAGVVFGGGATNSSSQSSSRVVAQVDIVPTLSLLLGLPVPFSNLGGIIPAFFHSFSAEQQAEFAVRNCLQIARYFRTQRLTSSADDLVLDGAIRNHMSGNFKEAQALYMQYLASSLARARTLWTTFSLPWMLMGILLIGMAMSLLPTFPPVSTVAVAVAGLHAVSCFSNSCILSEHWICFHAVCALLLLLLLRSADTLDTLEIIPALITLRLFLAPADAAPLPPIVTLLGQAWCLYSALSRQRQRLRNLFSSSKLRLMPALGLALTLLSRCCTCTDHLVLSLSLRRAALACIAADLVGAAVFLTTNVKEMITILQQHLAVMMVLVTPGQDRALIGLALLFFVLYPGTQIDPIHLSLIGRLAFFATQHRLDLGALHLNAGFTASETFSFYPAGLFLAINTFGWDVLSTLLSSQSKSQSQTSDSHSHSHSHLISYRVAVLLCACACCALHREHLMLWAVFAPKLVFELAFFVPFALTHLLVLR